MVMRAFRAIFTVDDQASAKLEQIKVKATQLNQTAVTTTLSLRQVGESLSSAAGGAAGTPAGTQALIVSQRIKKLGTEGRLTSASLQQLARRLDIAGTAASPRMSSRLDMTSKSLIEASAAMKVAEVQATATTSRFQFMGDVSDRVAMSMRRVSASAQGFMLGMSLLQKNLIGIGFSLIFLQFSGFLKLSLAMAGATLGVAALAMGLQKIFATRSQAKELARSFLIITGSVQSFALAEQRAKHAVKEMNIEGKDAKVFVNALMQAQAGLSSAQVLSGKSLRVFTELLAINLTEGGMDAEQAIQAALAATIDFAKSATRSEVDVLGFTTSLEDLHTKGGRAIATFASDAALPIETLQQGFTDLGDRGKALFDALLELYPELGEEGAKFGEQTGTLQQTLRYLFNLAGGDFETFSDAAIGAQMNVSGAFETILTDAKDLESGLSESLLRSVQLLNQMTAVADRMRAAARAAGAKATSPAYRYTPPAFVDPSIRAREEWAFADADRPASLSGFPLPTAAGGGSPVTLNIDIHDNQVRSPADLDILAGRILDGVRRGNVIGNVPVTSS